MEAPAWHILLVQCVTFGIGVLLLWVIALRPIRQVLKERRDRIETAQRDAAAAKTRALDVEKELRNRLSQLEADAKKHSQEAEAAARKLKEEILAGARAEAQTVVAQGREQVKRERAELRDQLRREVAKLSVTMARKVTAVSLTAKDRKRLMQKVLRELPSRIGGEA